MLRDHSDCHVGNGLERARVAAESPVRNPGLTQASGALVCGKPREKRMQSRNLAQC